MIVIGLTGGIASGKSTAAQHLYELGAHVIDADLLGHRAYEPDTDAYRAVIATFGDAVVAKDGSIDRKALASQVFGKPDELAKLTGIVWPEIRRLAEREIEDQRSKNPGGVTVLEAAVLLEAGWETSVDEVWVVLVDRKTAIERTMARDGLDSEAVKRRIDSQLSNDERVGKADVVIDNSSDVAELTAQLDAEWKRIANRQVAL